MLTLAIASLLTGAAFGAAGAHLYLAPRRRRQYETLAEHALVFGNSVLDLRDRVREFERDAPASDAPDTILEPAQGDQNPRNQE